MQTTRDEALHTASQFDALAEKMDVIGCVVASITLKQLAYQFESGEWDYAIEHADANELMMANVICRNT